MMFFWLKRDPSYQAGYLQFYPRFWQVKFSLSAFPVFFKSILPEEIFRVSHLWFLDVDRDPAGRSLRGSQLGGDGGAVHQGSGQLVLRRRYHGHRHPLGSERSAGSGDSLRNE